MASKVIIYISFYLYVLIRVSETASTVQTINGKIKITVGTASGCRDTANFINHQLKPAYDQYSQFLELEFVPWGRTRRNQNGTVTCQFGPNDCWANRLHRCALHLLKGNQHAQLNYMLCEFSSYPAYLQTSYLCAQAVGLNLIDVDYCIVSSSDSLEIIAEEASIAPMEAINFVPFITFNDVIDVNVHNQARRRLNSVLCFALADDPSTGITKCKI
ncbi:unnamed protein product [Parnassius mnemosyne]|uniref:GILT-like protein 1 n=1 Tax=Parnassius mnemosyne TaxID=213953 RepID=A0AAV1KTI5_9NEOP